MGNSDNNATLTCTLQKLQVFSAFERTVLPLIMSGPRALLERHNSITNLSPSAPDPASSGHRSGRGFAPPPAGTPPAPASSGQQQAQHHQHHSSGLDGADLLSSFERAIFPLVMNESAEIERKLSLTSKQSEEREAKLEARAAAAAAVAALAAEAYPDCSGSDGRLTPPPAVRLPPPPPSSSSASKGGS